MTKKVRAELAKLASYQYENGFDSDGETVEEYINNATARSAWKGVHEFLAVLRRDVWWHYAQVGEDEEMPIYEAMEQRIETTAEALR